MLAFWLLLFVSAAFSLPHGCHLCDENCRSKYDDGVLFGACKFGCHSSKGLNSLTDKYNVNVDCEQICQDYASDDEKSACYEGCTYIPAARIEAPGNTSLHPHGILSSPLLLKIVSFFLPNHFKNPLDDKTVVGHARTRIFIPEGLDADAEPQHMIGSNVKMVMRVMHGSVDMPLDASQIPRLQQSVFEEDVPTFSSSFCRRARIALHHLTTHPLFFASVILMFVTSLSLLIFACVRLVAYRSRRATFQRQYKRLPAFFKPASVKVSLLTPQPTSEDEAPELPPKEPIV